MADANSRRLVTLSVILILLVAAAALAVFYSFGEAGSSSAPINTTTTATTESNGTLLASRTWGSWSFKVSLNATSVSVGDEIELSEELTYLGHSNITVDEADPLVAASVNNSAGEQVWVWEPVGINGLVTVSPGETGGGEICIPITTAQSNRCEFAFMRQPVPGVYSLVAEPLFYSSSHQFWGSNLQISLSFTITN